MKTSRILLAAAFVPSLLGAQASDSLGQRGRTLIAVSLGLTGTRAATNTGSTVSASSSGQVAGLAVTHFVHPAVALEISTAVLDENDLVVAGRAHHEAVIPLLFGVTWAPTALSVDSELRPFVSLAGGPYTHTVDEAGSGAVSASTETVIGGRVGAGANWFLSRHFALQLEGDYHAVPSFDIANGARRDVSGFALSLGLGFAWGGK